MSENVVGMNYRTWMTASDRTYDGMGISEQANPASDTDALSRLHECVQKCTKIFQYENSLLPRYPHKPEAHPATYSPA
jgi:hypothetical protein